MSPVGILGGAGFVGSAYARLLAGRGVAYIIIDKANYADIKGSHFSVLINANGNSKKFLADQDPVGEFTASVLSVYRALTDFSSDVYVQLSTGDVYPTQTTPEETLEEQLIDETKLSRYGLHKFLAEKLVRATHSSWLIMRMGGFVGPGLKKNAIFDILTGADLWLDPTSQLQFIHTDTAARVVWDLIGSGVRNEIVNLGGRGVVTIGEINRRAGGGSGYRPNAAKIRFELSTAKLASLSSIALPSSHSEVEAFLALHGRA